MRAPSGEQFEIAFESQLAVVTEVGGSLRTYAYGDLDVLDGYGADEMSSSGRGQVLIPWPNRIAEGRFEFGGRAHQLPLNEPGRTDAIHGLARWVPWTLAERSSEHIVMRFALHPRPGYPFSLDLSIDYKLSGDGLRVSTTATNAGADACPYGAGAHPYLLPGSPVETATLHLPARSVIVTDERGIPVGTSPVEGTEFDFRQPRPVGGTMLDHCFTDLECDEDGLARVRLARTELGASVTLWADGAYPYLMLYTGDDRPDVNRHSMAVEPMTCPPQAFRSGEGVIVLEPGDSTTTTWGLSPSYGRAPDPRGAES